MRDKDNILSAYDTCSTHAEWIRKVSEALGMCYDYDGPFVAAESDKVVEYIKDIRERHWPVRENEMPENKHIQTPSAAVKITLSEACAIISKETGQTITEKTHWLKASIELTRDCPPYAIVQLEAFPR